MSDYHILDLALDKKTVSVVYHIPIPASGTNDAGVQWRVAVQGFNEQKSEDGTITSSLKSISAQELTDMQSGALFEQPARVRFKTLNQTPTENRDDVEADYIVKKDVILTELQDVLSFFGYEANVV